MHDMNAGEGSILAIIAFFVLLQIVAWFLMILQLSESSRNDKHYFKKVATTVGLQINIVILLLADSLFSWPNIIAICLIWGAMGYLAKSSWDDWKRLQKDYYEVHYLK